VQPMQGATPYVRFGNWPIVSWMFLMVAAAMVIRVQERLARNALNSTCR
jgi:apolipoprotein N-acyltransferase